MKSSVTELPFNCFVGLRPASPHGQLLPLPAERFLERMSVDATSI